MKGPNNNRIIRLFLLTVFANIIFFLTAQERTTLIVTGNVSNATSFTDKEVIINGRTELYISASIKPLVNSVIQLNSEDSWIYFNNIRPQAVVDSLLQYIYINGVQAKNDVNARVAIFRHGTLIMPHAPSYQPLTVYDEQNYGGNSQKYSLHVYNNNLGEFDNSIRSFKLKKGYMATFANNADGSGYSRVFIASDADLEVPAMSQYLDRTVSFIRVFKWEFVSKKGWCQTGWMSSGSPESNTNKMNGTWLYTWSADQSSKNNYEYVPEKWQRYWPSWDEINNKENISHVMSYNEPDHTEQSNITVAQAVAQWPEFMKSGLRIGSPACTEFSSWLYPFIDSIKARNYRCDYVVIHAYWGGLSASQWYNNLKAIYQRTGRPLWIKEWNNGASWTTEWWPDGYSESLTKQYNELKAILNVMDTASFVERYSIYNWVGYKRMLITDEGWITPAGELYRDSKPPLAFKKAYEVIPTYKFPATYKPEITLSANASSTGISVTWDKTAQEFAYRIVVERKSDNGEWTEVHRRKTVTSLASYTETPDFKTASKFSYRIRLLFSNGVEQISNEKSFFVVPGSDIQYGNLSLSNTDWNLVGFSEAYSTVPCVFTGAVTNNNLTALLTTKVKIASNRLMQLQLQPWAYQKITALTVEEKLPYFLIKPGTYDFGGLKAIALKTTVSNTWKTVNFPAPFDSVPVVLVSPATANNEVPVVVRIKNVTRNGFDVILQKESALSAVPVGEVFSYLAVQQGTGNINGYKIKVGRTAENAVGNAITQYARVVYDEKIDNPVFLSQLQTCNDDTVTATLRCRSVLTTEARVFKQRELSTGNTASAFETAGYILINPDVFNAMELIEDSEIRIYPNPVKDRLHFTKNVLQQNSIEIYNLSGLKVKTEMLINNDVDVNDLIQGYYFVKLKTGEVLKFVKQ
jgi:hypothetical protein